MYRKKSNRHAWLVGWLRHVYVLHWMPFALLAATWLGGYIIHANLSSPMFVLYYAAHIFAASGLFVVGMFYLYPGNQDIKSRLHTSAPNDITKITHRVFFHVLRIQPFIGVLIFFVPDSGLELGKNGAFWLNHLYNDNYAHMLHTLLFYLIILLGVVNFLFMLNKRRKGR